MPLTIKTPVYEGPLDLLLELIEKRKLLINDISLAKVTDEYIASIAVMEEMPVSQTADFVALASTLLLIKSRSLLPTLTISEEESKDIKELEHRLTMYKLLKETAKTLQLATNKPYSYEGSAPEAEPLFMFDTTITFESLQRAAYTLIESFPTIVALPKVAVKKIISLEEMIEKLGSRVSQAIALSFKNFNSQHGASSQDVVEIKHTIIVSFLALLELVKQGIIRAQQDEHFADITLKSDEVSILSI